MAAFPELVRTVTVSGSLFAPAPFVGRRCARAEDRAAARGLILQHMARARRWAGVTLRVSGEDNIPPTGAFVLVYNQTSLADDLGNQDVLWKHLDHSTLAAEYGWIPFFRRAAERVALVLVQRGNRSATDRVFDRLSGAARTGYRIAVAAEGRLSPDGEVGHCKRGAFLVAICSGVPIVPMCARGAGDPRSRLGADARWSVALPNWAADRFGGLHRGRRRRGGRPSACCRGAAVSARAEDK